MFCVHVLPNLTENVGTKMEESNLLNVCQCYQIQLDVQFWKCELWCAESNEPSLKLVLS